MRGRSAFVLILLSIALVAPRPADAQTLPVVHGVLFFSPSCGHCEYVIQEVLPPLFDANGGPWELRFDEALPATEVAYFLLTNGTLEFLLVDVTIASGAELFQTTTDTMSIASNGVPRLIVASQVMIGSGDIPDRLPGLIDVGLAGEGIDWPEIPGLDEILAGLPVASVGTTTTTQPGSVTTATTVPVATTTVTTLPLPPSGGVDRTFGDDAFANSIAVVVLVILLAGLAYAIAMLRRADLPTRPGGLVPWLVLAGLVIASYLTYVELGSVEAVCGPVGDCNAVQQSEYATVAGIPIGLVGLAGYLTIGALWLVQRRSSQRRADLARVGVAAIATGGVAFSAWLTFLEPFVIHATCAWCVASALVIGALMWITVPAGVAAWRRLAPVSAPG